MFVSAKKKIMIYDNFWQWNLFIHLKQQTFDYNTEFTWMDDMFQYSDRISGYSHITVANNSLNISYVFFPSVFFYCLKYKLANTKLIFVIWFSYVALKRVFVLARKKKFVNVYIFIYILKSWLCLSNEPRKYFFFIFFVLFKNSSIRIQDDFDSENGEFLIW